MKGASPMKPVCGETVAVVIGGILAGGIAVLAFVLIGWIPSPPAKPVADLYQKDSGLHRNVVIPPLPFGKHLTIKIHEFGVS